MVYIGGGSSFIFEKFQYIWFIKASFRSYECFTFWLLRAKCLIAYLQQRCKRGSVVARKFSILYSAEPSCFEVFDWCCFIYSLLGPPDHLKIDIMGGKSPQHNLSSCI